MIFSSPLVTFQANSEKDFLLLVPLSILMVGSIAPFFYLTAFCFSYISSLCYQSLGIIFLRFSLSLFTSCVRYRGSENIDPVGPTAAAPVADLAGEWLPC